MTSEERREARFQRRKVQRAEKKQAHCADCDVFDKVFSYDHLYHAYKKCRRNVAWKSSTQKYITQAPLYVYQTQKALMNDKFKSSGFVAYVYGQGSKGVSFGESCNSPTVVGCAIVNSELCVEVTTLVAG